MAKEQERWAAILGAVARAERWRISGERGVIRSIMIVVPPPSLDIQITAGLLP